MMVSGGELDENGRSHYGEAEVIPEGLSWEQAMQHAGLDYDVERLPIFDETGSEIPGFKRLERDGFRPYAVVSDRYRVVPNRDAFRIVEFAIGEGAKWIAGGVNGDGRKAWGLLTLPEEVRVAGEYIAPFVLFQNTFDGSGSIVSSSTPIRPACTNALNWTLRSAERTVKMQHTGNIEDKLADAQRMLGSGHAYFEELATIGDALAQKRVSDRQLKRLLEQLYPNGTEDTDKQKENIVARREQVRRLVNEAPNLDGHHGTAWAFVNAVAEVVDWGSTRQRDRVDRLAWDTRLKNKALALAVSMN